MIGESLLRAAPMETITPIPRMMITDKIIAAQGDLSKLQPLLKSTGLSVEVTAGALNAIGGLIDGGGITPPEASEEFDRRAEAHSDAKSEFAAVLRAINGVTKETLQRWMAL